MLTLHGVSKTFRLGKESVRALDGIDLGVGAGEFLTVIGSNGAGKTTLLNVIAGTCWPDSGRIAVAGQDVTAWPAYRRARFIGRVFQDPRQGTAPHLTVAENLALAAQKGPRTLRWALGRARLAFFRRELAVLGMDLEKRLNERAAYLSGGERQALAVLMATFTRPKVLLLDEHTAALDPAHAERVLEITDQLVRAHHITSLMVTHRMDHALRVGSRLVMMHKGRVLLDLGAAAKANLGVEDLVGLFRKVGVVDDELLLTDAKACAAQ